MSLVLNLDHKIIRKLTGSIGGNGYCGPIYGELTMGSMHKMIKLMILIIIERLNSPLLKTEF